MPDLLIELLSEEIPARMQARAAEDLRRLVTEGLVAAGLTYASAQGFATPRRLVLAVAGMTAQAPEQREQRRGPRVDAPEKALEGFLRSTGLSRDQLQAVDDKKGQIWMAEVVTPGRPAEEIVAEVLEATVRGFPWPKSMRWGAGSLRWVRPLHSILCVMTDEAGATVVPLDIDGIAAGNRTQGHRFLAPDSLSVTGFDDYAAKLKRAHVILDPAERAETIWHDVTNGAFARGLEAVEDRGLLAEVAGLVEWPVVLIGAIDPAFLGLPPEVLQTSMREHQKFFSLRNPATGRIEAFATVANTETADHGETILRGNRKVLAARLSDAAFFWQNDLAVARAGMEAWRDALGKVTFHNKLGSQADRIERIAALAREIAPMVGADPEMAAQAARVAKADLASQMVYEFPELQGVMGRYYALESGLAPEIATAAQMHYKPLGPSDEVPTEPVSIAVALADKLDLLTGFWAINEKPTGSKDPFALRRAALGVIRIVLFGDARLSLQQAIHHSNNAISDQWIAKVDLKRNELKDLADRSGVATSTRTGFRNVTDIVSEDAQLMGFELNWVVADQRESLIAFFHDRLKVHLRDEGIRHDVIDACLAMPGNDDLTLLVNRAEALAGFLKTEDGANLLQGFKRANNILTQAEAQDGVAYEYGPDRKFAETDTERALFDALDAAEPVIAAAMQREDFAAAMSAMAGLRAPIDGFFDSVQVNTDNGILRRNRLNLLHRIREICLRVADLRRLEG